MRNKASTTPWGIWPAAKANRSHSALATAFLYRDMLVEFHEKLFGYVDHAVDEVLSVPAFDDDNE